MIKGVFVKMISILSYLRFQISNCSSLFEKKHDLPNPSKSKSNDPDTTQTKDFWIDITTTIRPTINLIDQPKPGQSDQLKHHSPSIGTNLYGFSWQLHRNCRRTTTFPHKMKKPLHCIRWLDCYGISFVGKRSPL